MASVPTGSKLEPERKLVITAVVESSRARSQPPVCRHCISSSHPQPRKHSLSLSLSSCLHPVAAVLVSSRDANGYHTPVNRSSVLHGSEDEDEDDDVSCIAAVISEVAPVMVPSARHLSLRSVCVPEGDTSTLHHIQAMLDTGSHLDLVNPSFAQRLNLKQFPLTQCEKVSVAIGGKKTDISSAHVVKFRLSDLSFMYSSHIITACVAPQLSMDVLLGMPFLM